MNTNIDYIQSFKINGNYFIYNAIVYDTANSIVASKYPMSTDTEILNDNITETTKKLANCESCSGHDSFLKGIIVSFDIDLSIKATVEMLRYHFIDIVSSQSTMHRIMKFNLDNQYIKYVDKDIIKKIKEKINEYNNLKEKNTEEAKEKFLTIIYSNPVGMILTQRVTTNYLQLKTIYKQRKNHLLPEWRNLCKWIEKLPNSNLIINNK